MIATAFKIVSRTFSRLRYPANPIVTFTLNQYMRIVAPEVMPERLRPQRERRRRKVSARVPQLKSTSWGTRAPTSAALKIQPSSKTKHPRGEIQTPTRNVSKSPERSRVVPRPPQEGSRAASERVSVRLEGVSRACGCTPEPRSRGKRLAAVRQALRGGWSEDELELALVGAVEDGWAVERGIDMVTHAVRNPEGYLERGRRSRQEQQAAEGERDRARLREQASIRKCEASYGPHTRQRLEAGESFAFCVHCEFTIGLDESPESSGERAGGLAERVEVRARAPVVGSEEARKDSGRPPSELNARLKQPNPAPSMRSSPPPVGQLVDVREKLPELLRALGVKPRCG